MLFYLLIVCNDVLELSSLIDNDRDLDLNKLDDLGIIMMYCVVIDGSYCCLNFFFFWGVDVNVIDF